LTARNLFGRLSAVERALLPSDDPVQLELRRHRNPSSRSHTPNTLIRDQRLGALRCRHVIPRARAESRAQLFTRPVGLFSTVLSQRILRCNGRADCGHQEWT